jgi:lysozyme
LERRNLKAKGLAIICHFEGERNIKAGWNPKTKMYHPYLDPVGIPTIGIGTIAYGEGTRVTMKDSPITEDSAYALMNFELDEKEDAVQRFLLRTNLTINDDQFDALVSMAYNCGVGILEPGSSLRTALMSGNLMHIRAAIMLYVKGTVTTFGIKRKVTLPGLVRRRKSEAQLFCNGEVIFYQ